MRFPSPLEPGTLVQRYKRFFVDVATPDGPVTAHCPNPGAMLGLKEPGTPVWMSRSTDPKRKLALTLEMVEVDGGLVGINTMNPNKLAWEAIAEGRVPELAGYARMRREVKYDGDSRVDILLEDDGRPPAWVEIKNCHFRREGRLAEFPDCVAARSAKHMAALARRVEAGERAVVLWVIQREDCETFDTARDIDPAFAAALDAAADAGVEVLPYACKMSLEGVVVDRRLPWKPRR